MKKIIKLLKQQKPKAQEKIFQLYADYLFRVCYRYLKNRESAEDVLSQAFIKIFSEIKNTDITEEVQLKNWMKRIAVNEALMLIRSSVKFARQTELTAIADNSEIDSETELLEADLTAMVMNLPAGYRTVFSLYAIEGYQHHEIARQLNISAGTSKSQLSKARKMLRQMIEEENIRSERIAN